MSNEGDPGLWRQAAEWLWALLLMPVGALWKKVDNSASKDELASAMRATHDDLTAHMIRQDQQRREIMAEQEVQRGHIAKVFDKLEETRTDMHKGQLELMQAIHASHSSRK